MGVEGGKEGGIEDFGDDILNNEEGDLELGTHFLFGTTWHCLYFKLG